MTSVELLMRRAHELARRGAGRVSPNPLVGCVIVKDDKIIGEGWHQAYGGPHAEVNAVASVSDKARLEGSTVFVNLEPCSHHGKTPPCADLLVHHKCGKVIISNVDPNPLVRGQGIAKLERAGIEVVAGILEQEGSELNRRFFKAMDSHRPYVILKWAQTSNGLIAGGESDPRWISNTLSRRLVHKWRSEEDAVLVGYRTAVADNPKLNVREWTGRDPVRIVIDRNLSLPPSLHLFDGTQRTIVVNATRENNQGKIVFLKISEGDFIPELLRRLYEQQIHSVLVEGGRATFERFIGAGLWDESRVFESRQKFQSGLAAPNLSVNPSMTLDLGGDVLSTYQNLMVNPVPVK